ncbi:MAG: diaminopimelate decarboxylase [Myxococcota bacterium]
MSSARRFPALRHEIAGISVEALAREFGTPLWVYDTETIARQLERLRAFDVVRYAQKANGSLAILDQLRRLGARVDAVSAGEVHRALAAGFKGGDEAHSIVYTADLFDRDALELVLKHRIHVNCGSPDMIDQYGERARGSEITLRINPGFGHGHHRKTNTGGAHSKHGIWYEQIGESLARARRHELGIHGVHVHIGSGTDLGHLSSVCEALQSFALEIGPEIHSVSAGGGLPVPYSDEDEPIDLGGHFSRWDAVRRRLEETFGHAVELEIEPGRFLVAEAGFLVCEIRAIKTTASHRFYLVDAGFGDLLRPALYGAYHPISIVPSDGARERASAEVVVGGPLCESGDIFTQDAQGYVEPRRLPEARVGELLVLECAGAYGYAMSSNYNARPRGAEVSIQGGRVHRVRARETFEDLMRGETIPPED